ncbi:MAG: vitamin B12-dependent ribonucleotide reductase, partial [candidate division Zixibacteria bacterium]|nr:vitamin B12-dependent ribonucleotide reductase [candidate division Zixibacteria bacterium]
LMNAGRPLGQLSACFVIPVEDTMESIFTAVKDTALIHKSGGGTGFSFSRLRPKNSPVASTSGVASGPISFMKVINAATEAVKQGGTRRGANMAILRVDHPDILEFVCSKDDLKELTNFNISVAVTDTFMKAMEKDKHYDLIDPRTKKEYRKDGKPVRYRAKEIFNLIVEHAWRTGEPGMMFLDKMNQGNPITKVGLYESTNPCGEQPLLPYESCNLGSINLSKMLKNSGQQSVTSNQPQPVPNPKPQAPAVEVDWDKLENTVKKAVHFLDNVIDANNHPLAEIKENTRANRKIGLGVMGWADMLVQLRIPYNSTKAVKLAEQVMGFIKEESHQTSSELGKERGNFPNWEKSIYYEKKIPMRNSTVTTIAPAGTISIIASCSSGIEPLFAISYIRTVMDNTKLVEVNPFFEKEAKQKDFYSKKLMEKVAQKGSIGDFNEIPEDVKKVFVVSHDIAPEWHVRMQAAFQKYTDNAVSKTINLPNQAKVGNVETAYRLAYELGCKGVTIYRDGSREAQVLSTKKEKEEEEEKIAPMDRPACLNGITDKIKTGYGNLYVTINSLNGKPFEVFAQIGKSGYSTMADTEAICRLISLALRSGISVEKTIEQLIGIGGASPIYQEGGLVMSIPDAIAKVLNKHFGKTKIQNSLKDLYLEYCPDCGGKLEHESGCLVCRLCGFSKC